ncbi:unnamed protein product [Urochloa humidicola]
MVVAPSVMLHHRPQRHHRRSRLRRIRPAPGRRDRQGWGRGGGGVVVAAGAGVAAGGGLWPPGPEWSPAVGGGGGGTRPNPWRCRRCGWRRRERGRRANTRVEGAPVAGRLRRGWKGAGGGASSISTHARPARKPKGWEERARAEDHGSVLGGGRGARSREIRRRRRRYAGEQGREASLSGIHLWWFQKKTSNVHPLHKQAASMVGYGAKVRKRRVTCVWMCSPWACGESR